MIREQIDKIKSAFSAYKNFELFYAVKANYSDIVLREVKKANIGVAVSSWGELEKIQKYFFGAISFTAPYVPKNVLQSVKRGGIELNYNNYSELQNNPVSNCGIRINPEIGWSYLKDYLAGALGSQFGISHRDAVSLDLSMVTRLHMHTSSDSYRIDVFISGLKRLLKVAALFPNINTINIGGGIAVPIGATEGDFDIDLYATRVIDLFNKFYKRYNRNLKIQMEPGNYIVRPSTFYVCRIMAVDKKNNDLYYFTDGTKHHLKGLSKIQKINFLTKANKKTSAKILGCTCQRSDVIYDGVGVPELSIGDLVIVPMTGAYCLVQGDDFHLLKRPGEYCFN